MRIALLGYNLEVAKKMKLSISDLVFLRWFVDFKQSGKMVKEYDPKINDFKYWVTYNKIIDDMPILVNYTESVEGAKKQIQRMFKGSLGQLIDRSIVKSDGITKVYLSINEVNYGKLISTATTEEIEALDKNVYPLDKNVHTPLDKNVHVHWTETSNNKLVNNKLVNNKECIQEIECVNEKEHKKNAATKVATHTRKDFIDLSFINEFIDQVNITQKEYDNLVKKFGIKLVNNIISDLDEKITNEPKRYGHYKDHNKTIHKWCNMQISKNPHIVNTIVKEKKQSTTPKVDRDAMLKKMKEDREKEWRDKALKKVK